MPRPLFSHVLNLRETVNLPLKNVSASQSITSAENVWICDATAGNVTLTLPDNKATRGHFIYFVKTENANSVIIQRAGTDVITYAAATSVTLTTRDQDTMLVSDGNGTWIKMI